MDTIIQQSPAHTAVSDPLTGVVSWIILPPETAVSIMGPCRPEADPVMGRDRGTADPVMGLCRPAADPVMGRDRGTADPVMGLCRPAAVPVTARR